MMQVIWDLSCQDLNGARMPFAMSCNLKLSFHKAKGTEDRRGGEGGDHRSTVWDRTGQDGRFRNKFLWIWKCSDVSL
jgi:hypothetical protein